MTDKSSLILLLKKHLSNIDWDIKSITDVQYSQLIDFVLLIDKWNKTYNLTSIKNVEDMLVKHIVDSIVISPFLKGENFIDVGTGPGLPGIPLAILNPNKKFLLLDSLSKRINFIKAVKRTLHLDNIEPILSRCEEFTPNSELVLDGVLSRAFASLTDMINLCNHMIPENGKFLALKGHVIEDELASVPKEYQIEDIIKLNVPNSLGQRHLIIINNKGLM